MLSIKLICVGKMREKFYIDAFEEYRKRLQAYCRLELAEITEQRLSDRLAEKEIDAALEREGQEILKAVPADACLVALCVEGKQMPSEGSALSSAALSAFHPRSRSARTKDSACPR